MACEHWQNLHYVTWWMFSLLLGFGKEQFSYIVIIVYIIDIFHWNLFFSLYKLIVYISVFNSAVWMNMNPHVRSHHVPITRIQIYLLFRPHWRCMNRFIMMSVHIAVMCIINHSILILILKDRNSLILESIHLIVMCVIYHSMRKLIWWDINPYTVGSVLTHEMCVINHS